MACRHKRYGALLFHKKCDLVKALSAALGKGKTYSTPNVDSSSCSTMKTPLSQQNKIHQNTSSEVEEKSTCTCSIEEQIQNVSVYLNDRVHRQEKTLITSFSNSPQRYATFDMALYKEMVDPILLHFIELVTQSVRNRRRKLFQSETPFPSLLNAILCQYTVLHALLTEATLCHGGTQELVKILNRVGAVASIDTNQHLATQVVQARMARGVLPELEERALSIVSIDNIDILQPHAFVSCTDATRSWHGTSVQCVQPLPLTGILEEEELNVLTRSCSRKHPASSPAASPIPMEKRKRRRRTLTELHSPHSSLSIPQVHHMPSTLVFDGATYNIHVRPLQVDDFRLSSIEKTSMNMFQEDIFKCMLLKYAPQTTHHLPGLQSLLNCIHKQTCSCEESRVAYVEISSERADSRSTLITILGKM